MRIAITVETDEAKAFAAHFPERVVRGSVRAVNRGTNAGRTLVNRLLAGDTGLKSGEVRERLRVRPATFARPEAELSTSRRPIPLIEFRAKGPEPSRGRGQGVSYRIGTGSSSRIPNAFIETVGGGHRGVFKRTGRKRLPIGERFGPSLAKLFDSHVEEVRDRIIAVTQQRLEHELSLAAQGLDVSSDEGGGGGDA